MINLLPPDVRESYRFARRNVVVRSWVLTTLVVLVGLGGLATYGLLTIHQDNVTATKQVTATQTQLKDAKLAETQKTVKDISNSLKLAVQVLGKEVLFSKLIAQIGAAMPNGTVLTGLNINQIGGGLDLSASATDYTSATQIQVNLADPGSKLFSRVDINNISCSGGASSDAEHPCSVTLRALFNSDNQFLFINNGKKK